MLQQRAEELAQLELEFEDMEIVHKSAEECVRLAANHRMECTEASSSTAAEVRRLQNTVERGPSRRVDRRVLGTEGGSTPTTPARVPPKS